MIKSKWYNTLDFVCLLSQKSIHTVNSVCKIGKKQQQYLGYHCVYTYIYLFWFLLSINIVKCFLDKMI